MDETKTKASAAPKCRPGNSKSLEIDNGLPLDGENYRANNTDINLMAGVGVRSKVCRSTRSKCARYLLLFVIVIASTVLGVLYLGLDSNSWNSFFRPLPNQSRNKADETSPLLEKVAVVVPKSLVGVTYKQEDFINDAGVVPTFWNCSRVPAECEKAMTWGPCYASSDRINWKEEVERYHPYLEEKEQSYQRHGHMSLYHRYGSYKQRDGILDGFCRPGFVILGAGKCGTSSLYHYLTDHPRVLPASEKQIHYFKYHTQRSMKWYMSHFPTATSFLALGALMTGEASPGYLPYPDVAPLIAQRMPGSRLIVLGREPIDRMYSSFRYSYVYPTIEAMKKGRVSGVPIDLSDNQYQEKYLFSFQDMMRAELKVLRECLAPNGRAIIGARDHYARKPRWKAAYERRERLGLPPLTDLDSFCYGSRVNKTVIRSQWAELQLRHPEKVIIDMNTHLLQSHVGRSLYTLPLEWWYEQFDSQDIFFMCTEDLKDLSGAGMEPLRKWLGLPKFNFSSTLSQGAYNVGGHRGYDLEVKWDNVTGASSAGGLSSKRIPLSPELQQELQEFVNLYNERLFQLIGKRCNW